MNDRRLNREQFAETLTESEALDLQDYFSRKFGWVGITYSREDASDIWHNEYADDGNDTVLSDEEWDALRTSRAWVNLGADLSEDAYNFVESAVSVAKFNLGKSKVL